MNIELKILDARIQSVEYGTPHAAAVDLCAARIEGVPLTDALIIGPGAVATIGTGIAVHIGSIREDDGTEPVEFPDVSLAGLVLPRSGLGTKHRIRLANTAGLIDADYQGEIILAIENGDKEEPFIIGPMMRLAQMMIVPVARPAYRVVAEFSESTARGAGGFGSTGRT